MATSFNLPVKGDWPWDRLSDKEQRMFAVIRAYMDYHDLWYTLASNTTSGVDVAIKAVTAMSDAEVEAFLAMYYLDRVVNL